VLLNFCSCCCRIDKRHPRVRPSGRRRLTLGSVTVVLCIQLDEDILTVATWATIASHPAWPFHFFTDVSPADVTSIESRLVHYSLLSCCFHRTYK
jgi:hypothetical protein